MLNNYLFYLEYITNKIQKYFIEQKDYICCSKGCSKCCHNAQFPYTEIEFKLIYEGFKALEPSVKKQVIKKIDTIISDMSKHLAKKIDKPFRYICPFLINNKCSVYYYRGLICRTFGLMTFIPDSPQTPLLPFYAYEGLNYSKVLDKENNNISDIKFAELGIKEEPKAYNIDYSTLTNNEIAEGFGFKFGEVKPLIEWFITTKN